MTDSSYAIVFSGEILDGFDPDEVRARIARVFNLSAERLHQLFTHPRVVLKGNLNQAQASHYQSVLEKAGLKTAVERAASTPGAAGRPAAPAAAKPKTVDRRAAVESDQPANRRLPFEFTGTGEEFFRIWIVNVLLTIVTLGIYSAWAKVRTKRYFYGNTRLDGSSFEYLADPVKILKGRIIAVTFLVSLSALQKAFPLLAPLGSLFFVVITPWIVVQSMRFRARNSAWRNVTFGFDGSLQDAVKAYVGWPMMAVLSLGILWPYAYYQQQRFLVENSRFGATPFRFDGDHKGVYRALVGLVGIMVAGGLVAVLLAAVLKPIAPLVGPLAMIGIYFALFAYFTAAMTNYKYNNSFLDKHRLGANYATRSYLKLIFTNTLGMALTLGLFYPWAKVRTARYAAEHIQLDTQGRLDHFLAVQREQVAAYGQEMGDLFDMDLGL